MTDYEAFQGICGDCAGVDIENITPEDIKIQAQYWNEIGETVSDEMLDAALRYIS